MAKAKTTKTVKAQAEQTVSFLRRGARAYLGLYVVAYDRAKMRAEQVRKAADGLFDDLVVKGEQIETQAVVIAKGASLKAREAANDTVAKVRDVLPTAGQSRVAELEAEVEKLNKKLVALNKKTSKPVKKASMKTTKTVKKAAPKPTAETAPVKADETVKAA